MIKVVLVAVTVLLAGCDNIRAIYTPLEQKVTAAFPVPEELQVAQAKLFADLEADPAAKALAQTQLAQKMSVRALACSTEARLGRLDTALDIKKKITSTACFREHDATLAEWIGLRRFGIAARKPALVPLAPLPASTAIASHEETAVGIVTARAANVVVIKGNRSRLTSVSLPSGKAIASFASPARADRQGSLSPNGRLLALPVSNTGLHVLDAETGSLVWSTDKYNDVLAWLPEVDAVLLSRRGDALPQLLDLRTGAIDNYPVPMQRVTWAVPVPGTPARHAVGEYRNAALVDHTRSADGNLAVQVVKQWQLTGSGVSSMRPIVMRGGKLITFVSGGDFAWLDMESGNQGVWNFSLIGGHGYSKVSESTIYLDTRSTVTRSEGKLFDIDQGTLRTADGSSNDGLLMPLGDRDGYMRRGHPTVVIGTAPQPQGEPQALEAVISEAQLAQQLAKVNAAQAMETMARGGSAGVEDMMRRRLAAGLTSSGAPMPAAVPARPLLSDVPADAKVSVIGVYEPASTTRRPDGTRGGSIRVSLAPGRQPIVLVLASYESVNWVINDNGRKVAAILVSGYNQSNVIGAGNTPVLKIGSTYAYKMDTPQYEQLKREVARYVPNPVGSFQGGYKGQEFSVY